MELDVPDPVHFYHIRYRTGSDNLPGLVYVMGLSIDHLFCICLTQNAPLFTTLHTGIPYFGYFITFSSKTIKLQQIKKKKSLNCLDFLCNFTSSALFLKKSWSPIDLLFARKLTLISLYLIWCVLVCASLSLSWYEFLLLNHSGGT